MGLWRDLNDPLVRAIVGSPVGADAASSSTLVERVRVNLVPHAPHTAEERHIALLYGEPQDGGAAESGTAAYVYDPSVGRHVWGTLTGESTLPYAERSPFDDDEEDALDREINRHVLYGDLPLNENGAYACALGTCDPEWDCGGHIVEREARNPFLDDAYEEEAWFDIGTCAGCGTYGRLGRVHYAKGTECGEYI
jgi:hypothetical protein